MADFKQECKLCDNIISDENFKVIDVAKDIFNIRLLKLMLNDTQIVMCTTCSSKLNAALNFKSKCIQTDSTIIPYVDFKNQKSKPVDLKQIYAKEKGSKQESSMLDDQEVCRLCLQPMCGDHKSIQEVPVSSIEIYIPEINFEATTTPVICIKCYDALHIHSAFIKNCLDVNKRRNGHAWNGEEIFLNDRSLKTEEMEIKSEETEEEILSETFCDIKKEEHDKGDTSDLMYTEESKSLYKLDHQKQTSALSTFADNQSEECSFKSTAKSRSAGQERRHKTVSEAQVNKSDYSNQNLELRGLTRGLKVQEYKCDKCAYDTKHKHDLKKHEIVHKGSSEVQMFKCDKCRFITKHKGNLIKHCLTHKDPSEVRVFQCDECDYKSKQKGNLLKHQLRHKDPSKVRIFKCDECNYKSIRKEYVKQHQLRHKDPSEVQMFKCDQCDHKTIHKYHLKQHQLIHKDPAEVKMFLCDKCPFETKHKRNLINHCLRHRDPSEVQMFECGECDYRTIDKRSLKKHQLIHKNPSVERMFKCYECDYKSTLKGNLKRHQLTHKKASVKVYKCDKCKFETKQKSNFINHCLGHSDLSEVQMLECDYRTVFQCDECDYKSIRKHHLLQHQIIHKDPAEVKMFKCDKCTFETKHKRNLIDHFLRHRDPSEQQMLECGECNYRTVDKRSLKKHNFMHKDLQQ